MIRLKGIEKYYEHGPSRTPFQQEWTSPIPTLTVQDLPPRALITDDARDGGRS